MCEKKPFCYINDAKGFIIQHSSLISYPALNDQTNSQHTGTTEQETYFLCINMVHYASKHTSQRLKFLSETNTEFNNFTDCSKDPSPAVIGVHIHACHNTYLITATLSYGVQSPTMPPALQSTNPKPTSFSRSPTLSSPLLSSLRERANSRSPVRTVSRRFSNGVMRTLGALGPAMLPRGGGWVSQRLTGSSDP